jgi:hypothetical protein
MTTNNTAAASTVTDLVAAEKKALDVLNRSMAKSDLDDLMRGARRSVLLVDCSGSMGESLNKGGRKIDALRSVVATLRETNPVPVAAFGGFETTVVDAVPEPTGGTPLTRAIEFAHREGATHAVIVTDGVADCEQSALSAARAFGGVIDTIYIGNGRDRGAAFCKELAALTGGTASLTDLGKPKELAGSIRLMLGDGN